MSENSTQSSSSKNSTSTFGIGRVFFASEGSVDHFFEVLKWFFGRFIPSGSHGCVGFWRVDLSLWFSTRQVCAQEGKPLKSFPTWRYRVLKTALRFASPQSLILRSRPEPPVYGWARCRANREVSFGHWLQTPMGTDNSEHCATVDDYKMFRCNRRGPARLGRGCSNFADATARS